MSNGESGATNEVELSLAGLSVMLAMPVGRPIEAPVVMSILRTQHVMLSHGIPFAVQFQTGCAYVHIARNECTYNFLQSDRNRLFWVDSDIVWEPNDFIRLLALSTKMDVVGATYTAKQEGDPLFMLSISPEAKTNDWGCLPANSYGLGFTVVTRRVIEKLAKQSKKLRTTYFAEREPIPYIFYHDELDGTATGEDTNFLIDCGAAGFQPWLDPGTVLGHVGPKIYKANFAKNLRA